MSGVTELCLLNQKGGVGKTTVAVNTAGALNARGHEVLLVDLDPQGTATESTGLREAYDADSSSVFEVITDTDPSQVIDEAIWAHDELDLLPSSIEMSAVERELSALEAPREQLGSALQQVSSRYDFVIVDAPPTTGHLLENALLATKQVLIPALAEATSKRAFELLIDHIVAMEQGLGIEIEELGVVLNRIDVRRNQAHEMIEWVEKAFEGVPIYELRERAVVQKAFASDQTLCSFAPETDAAAVFDQIAADLEVVCHD